MGYETFDKLCKMNGVTPYRVAQETGVSTATISSWKNGRYEPKDDKLQKLANYFNVTAYYLRTGDPEGRSQRLEKIAKEISARMEHRSALGITNEEWELLSAFRYLNQTGAEKAMQNVVDLTQIEWYRKPEYSEGYIRT